MTGCVLKIPQRMALQGALTMKHILVKRYFIHYTPIIQGQTSPSKNLVQPFQLQQIQILLIFAVKSLTEKRTVYFKLYSNCFQLLKDAFDWHL